jgi:TetR/AcrR family transcriptional regulator, mexJK operon transcriptional repressor
MAQPVAPARGEAAAAILEAARALFAERGLHEVTMSEVAEAAGVARATVFNHFGSKHALVDAITADVLAGYVMLLDRALADRRTPLPVMVRALFEFMGQGIEQNQRFYRAIFREIAKASLGLEEGGETQAMRLAALDRLVQLHMRGQARGELVRGPGAEDLASAFDSLVFGTIIHWLYEDLGEPLAARMLRAAEVLLGGLAVDPALGYAGPAPRLTLDSPAPARPKPRRRAPSGERRRRR